MPDLRAVALSEAERLGLDPGLVLRVMQRESGGNPTALSDKGAYGPMQLMPGTARDLGVDPRDPVANTQGGVRYLKQQMDAFGSPELALAAYNAGPGAVRKYGGVPPYSETKAYVGKIMGSQSSDDIFGFAPAASSKAAPAANNSDDIFGFGGTDKPAPAPPVVPPTKAKPPLLTDVGKSAAGAAIRTPGSLADTLGGGPGSVPFFLDLAGSAASALGAPRVSAALHGTAEGMSSPFSKATARNIPAANYQPQTLPGKLAEKAVEVAPGALVPGSIPARIAAVGLPTVGGVAGRETVKAAGGGPRAQAVGDFVGTTLGGAKASLRLPKAKPAAPSLEELQGQNRAAWEAVDKSGVRYKPATVNTLIDGIEADLKAARLSEKRHPKAFDMLEELKSARDKPMSPAELNDLRFTIRRDVNSAGGGEAVMGQRMIKMIDKFTDQVGGGPELGKARDLNTRVRKIEAVNEAVEKAANRTGASGNFDTALRGQLRPILEKTHNLTPAEEKALKSIVRGSLLQNVMSRGGKLSPTSGVIGAGVQTVLAPLTHGASIPVTMVAKGIGDQMTLGKVNKLVDLMARGGKPGLQAEEQLALMAQKNPQISEVYRQVARVLIPAAATATALPAAARPQSQQLPRKPASQR